MALDVVDKTADAVNRHLILGVVLVNKILNLSQLCQKIAGSLEKGFVPASDGLNVELVRIDKLILPKNYYEQLCSVFSTPGLLQF